MNPKDLQENKRRSGSNASEIANLLEIVGVVEMDEEVEMEMETREVVVEMDEDASRDVNLERMATMAPELRWS